MKKIRLRLVKAKYYQQNAGVSQLRQKIQQKTRLVRKSKILQNPPIPLNQKKSPFAEPPPPLVTDVICEQPLMDYEKQKWIGNNVYLSIVNV